MTIAQHYIDGAFIDADGPLADSVNPADNSLLGQYHLGSAALCDAACQVAHRVFFTSGWAENPRLRAQVLTEIADQLEAAKQDLVELIIAENGKLRAEA